MTGPQVAPYASVAPVYDRLVGDAGFESIWEAFRHACRRYDVRFASAADIGCGTGRFLAALARLRPDATLVGVDRSPAMLAVARRRLGRRVRLLRQDMTRLRLPAPVDLLTCNFNSLNYLTDIEGIRLAFDCFRQNMNFRATLIGDIMLHQDAARVGRAFRQTIRLPEFRARWDIDFLPSNGGSVVTMNSCLRRPDRSWSCAREQHVQRWWPRVAVERLLRRAGFVILGVHRLDDHRPAGPNDRWVQLVARAA